MSESLLFTSLISTAKVNKNTKQKQKNKKKLLLVKIIYKGRGIGCIVVCRLGWKCSFRFCWGL